MNVSLTVCRRPHFVERSDAKALGMIYSGEVSARAADSIAQLFDPHNDSRHLLPGS